MAKTASSSPPAPPDHPPRLSEMIGRACLDALLERCVGLSETSASLFEADASLATESRSRAYCRFLDEASRAFCGDVDWRDAEKNPLWLCHNDCRARAARLAISSRQPATLRPCPGGLAIHAVPLIADERIVGALCLAHGAPPQDPETQAVIARRFKVDPWALGRAAQGSPPPLGDEAGIQIQAELLAALLMELYRAHQRRRQAERDDSLYHLLLESQSILVVKVDTAGHFLYVNPTYCETFGHPPEALLGRPFMPLVHEEDQAATEAALRALGQPPYHGYLESRALTTTGWRWFGWRAMAVRDETGAVVAVVGVGQDIDDRRRAEEAQARSERRFRLLFEHATWGIFVHDLQGRFLNVNPRACRTLGYTREELLRLTVADVDPSIAGQTDPKGFWRSLEIPRELSFETTHRRKDGSTFPVMVSVSAIEEDGDMAILAMARDISERKQVELERQRAFEILAHSNADLERFAYMVSHDLKEPARTLGAYARLLQRRYGGLLDEEARTFLGLMVDGARRMDALIHSSLELSRVFGQPPRFTEISLDTVVRGALDNLRVMLGEARGVVDVGPLPRVSGDDALLVSLFQNLISNALKYHRPDVAPHIQIGAEPHAGCWRIFVRDNGLGIAPESRKDIFELFHRLETPDLRPGLGIGLAVVRRIAETHGWDIEIDSEPGRGTTLFFLLPRLPPS